jgi:lactoylglutathione lyase
MLAIEAVNHVGIRVRDRERSVAFYESLGFVLISDVGFNQGHPVIMRHASGVVLNLLGPATSPDDENILMDVSEKYAGITHVALTVSSIAGAREFVTSLEIEITGSFSFGDMSAIFIRDPDRNVIELDAYGEDAVDDTSGYINHPG